MEEMGFAGEGRKQEDLHKTAGIPNSRQKEYHFELARPTRETIEKWGDARKRLLETTEVMLVISNLFSRKFLA